MNNQGTVRLGDIATYINGYAFKPSDWSDNGLPIIRIQNLTGNDYQTNYYNKEYNPKYLVKKGDVLISWSASLGVFVWEKEDALLNQHIFKVIFDKIDVDKDFFCLAVGYLLKRMGGEVHGSTMKHITKPRFDNTIFPLPDKNTQRLIAKKITTVDEIINKCKLKMEKLDELVKSRFVEMFGDPITNSHNFPLKTLSELGELGRGISKHRPRNAPELLGGVYPLIQTGDVANASLYILDYNSTYSETGFKQSKMWSKGTLCITIAANIAKTAILTFDSCFPDSIVGFNANELANNVFIHFWFSFFQEILEEQAPESAQKNINLKILSELKVIVPSINLQNQFADFVAKVEQQKTIVQKSIDKLEALKKSLMQEYFG